MVILGLIGLVILIVVVINITSSKNTKLFRRMWSSEKYSNFDAQHKAYDGLLEQFDIKIIHYIGGIQKNEKDRLEENILNMIGEAIEFDVNHPHNSGIKVVDVVIRNLNSHLNRAGVKDFDEILNNIKNIDYAEMAKAIKSALTKMTKSDFEEKPHAITKNGHTEKITHKDDEEDFLLVSKLVHLNMEGATILNENFLNRLTSEQEQVFLAFELGIIEYFNQTIFNNNVKTENVDKILNFFIYYANPKYDDKALFVISRWTSFYLEGLYIKERELGFNSINDGIKADGSPTPYHIPSAYLGEALGKVGLLWE